METAAAEAARSELVEQREWLAERLEGRGDSLRKSMPDTDADNGLSRYVARMAHYHTGVNTSMPVTATFDLQEWIDEQGFDASVSGITDDAGDEIAALVDLLVDDLLINHFEMDPTAAARRWKGLL
ncbi:hypothetical protein [Halorubrum sp. Atlit-26R]|uniref:hypothetical protein n=1 Tax=Halorubrum sp. Atlit-26R TaxID=2282128 RepID=UPI001313DF22|nr:hypothetical protein [Halorubrum sp. Atlit-26R]